MTYGVARAALLGFFVGDDDAETDIAGPIVISDSEGDADNGHTFEPRSRGISPRGRT
jgi:hypothetical protein